MAYHYKGKQSLLFQEFDEITRKKSFSFTQKKFLANIDTLYLSAVVESTIGPNGEDEVMNSYKNIMDQEKQNARDYDGEYMLFQNHPYLADVNSQLIMTTTSFAIYDYSIVKPEKYTLFMSSYKISSSTPIAVVQIKSEALWLHGIKAMVDEVYQDLDDLLSTFGFKIDEIKENRIDFAYHTNYIQNPTSYFASSKIGTMQESRFERWSLQGDFDSYGNAIMDYFTLGRRKSNNLFFRVYNKTKEVIEQGYKQFFFKLWHDNGMISDYDLYCYEKAFLNVSRFGYKHINIARLEYYLEYGNDSTIHAVIRDLIDPRKESLNHEEILLLADRLTPPITIILNVEIETKRKFHRTIEKGSAALLKLRSKNVPEPLVNVMKKLDNLRVYHDYITKNNYDYKGVIRFVSKEVDEDGRFLTSDFWTRLQSVKFVDSFVADDNDLLLIRNYSEDLNVDLLKTRIANSLSTYSIYKNGHGVKDFESFEKVKSKVLSKKLEQDVVDYLSGLTESEVHKAYLYKHKKMPGLISKLADKQLQEQSVGKHYTLIDRETGNIKADTNKS